mmetsp:Transcript_19395/g.29774  ORF Transcript_19395/g.29774 Transcript_19395/m.29774 type:complete len:154 (+) Transcript_19395:396-857(+)
MVPRKGFVEPSKKDTDLAYNLEPTAPIAKPKRARNHSHGAKSLALSTGEVNTLSQAANEDFRQKGILKSNLDSVSRQVERLLMDEQSSTNQNEFEGEIRVVKEVPVNDNFYSIFDIDISEKDYRPKPRPKRTRSFITNSDSDTESMEEPAPPK